MWEYLVLKYDADKDGKVSEKEYTRGEERWKRLDKNGDGFVEKSEVQSARGGRGEGRRGRGERGERGGRGERGERGGRGRSRSVAPKVGDVAPDFELLVLPSEAPAEGKEKPLGKDAKKKPAKGAKSKSDKAADEPEFVKLSSFKDKRPVALIFGSYT